MTDDMERKLRGLKSNLTPAREHLSEAEKDQLIMAIGGPRTVESIRKAMTNFPHERIPWLFSSLDSQLVIDIMANDMDAALARALAQKEPSQSRPSSPPRPRKRP
jgi:hypothetical protein